MNDCDWTATSMIDCDWTAKLMNDCDWTARRPTDPVPHLEESAEAKVSHVGASDGAGFPVDDVDDAGGGTRAEAAEQGRSFAHTAVHVFALNLRA